jgi:cell wall-associated NlpC family hydrolase
MSKTLPGFSTPRRFVALLMAAFFGLTLAVNPASAPPAQAASVDAVRATVAARALRVAAAQVGVQYLYGGTTRRGFDCSGLTQYAFARVGKRIPRTTTLQYRATARVTRGYQRPGDLIFFQSGTNINHVGIYAGNGNIWHSPQTGSAVKLSKIWKTRFLIGRVR